MHFLMIFATNCYTKIHQTKNMRSVVVKYAKRSVFKAVILVHSLTSSDIDDFGQLCCAVF